jgi:hypothetical protein
MSETHRTDIAGIRIWFLRFIRFCMHMIKLFSNSILLGFLSVGGTVRCIPNRDVISRFKNKRLLTFLGTLMD